MSTACASGNTHSADQTDAGARPGVAADTVQAGFYRARVGAVPVTVLSDGTAGLDLSSGLLLNTKPGEVEGLLARAFQESTIDASFNAFMIKMDGRMLLIDTGAGTNFGPTAGKIEHSLAASGARAEDISDVFLTHIHPDHSGGLVVNGKRVFPKATIHVEQRELDYWLDKDRAAKATGMDATFFSAASAALQPYLDAGKVEPFSGATEFLQGFSAAPAYGHTPGHVTYQLESNGEKLVFWSDLIHVAAVQFDDPGVAVAFDVDPTMAVATRKSALAKAADGGYLVAHNHIAFPGIGHVGKDGDVYRWVAVPYVNDSPGK